MTAEHREHRSSKSPDKSTKLGREKKAGKKFKTVDTGGFMLNPRGVYGSEQALVDEAPEAGFAKVEDGGVWNPELYEEPLGTARPKNAEVDSVKANEVWNPETGEEALYTEGLSAASVDSKPESVKSSSVSLELERKARVAFDQYRETGNILEGSEVDLLLFLQESGMSPREFLVMNKEQIISAVGGILARIDAGQTQEPSSLQTGGEVSSIETYDPGDVHDDDGNLDEKKMGRNRDARERGAIPVFASVDSDGAGRANGDSGSRIQPARNRDREGRFGFVYRVAESDRARVTLAAIALGGVAGGIAGWAANEYFDHDEHAGHTQVLTTDQYNQLTGRLKADEERLDAEQKQIDDLKRQITDLIQKRQEQPPITAKTSGELTDEQAFKAIDSADGTVDGKLTVTIKAGSNFDNDLGATLNNIGVNHFDSTDRTINGGPRWVETSNASGGNGGLYRLVYPGQEVNVDPQLLVSRFRELNVNLKPETLGQIGVVAITTQTTAVPSPEAKPASGEVSSINTEVKPSGQAGQAAASSKTSVEANTDFVGIAQAHDLNLDKAGKFNIDDLETTGDASVAILADQTKVNVDSEVAVKVEEIQVSKVAAIEVARKQNKFYYSLVNRTDGISYNLKLDQGRIILMFAAAAKKKEDDDEEKGFIESIMAYWNGDNMTSFGFGMLGISGLSVLAMAIAARRKGYRLTSLLKFEKVVDDDDDDEPIIGATA